MEANTYRSDLGHGQIAEAVLPRYAFAGILGLINGLQGPPADAPGRRLLHIGSHIGYQSV
jgi:hypothetical protein